MVIFESAVPMGSRLRRPKRPSSSLLNEDGQRVDNFHPTLHAGKGGRRGD